MKCIKLEAHVVSESDPTKEGGYKATRALLDDSPTAIIAPSEFAVGTMAAASERGLRVPQDLSLIVHNNTSPSQPSHIGLTSIVQPTQLLASEAFRLLVERINGRSEAQHLTVAPTLVERTTTTYLEKP